MSPRTRSCRRNRSYGGQTPRRLEERFNIIRVDSLLTDHPSLRFPEVRAAARALHAVEGLRRPPLTDEWHNGMHLMDWLQLFFGFQTDNVRNQMENLVLHLANSQMRLRPPPAASDVLDPSVLRHFRVKLLQSYTSWCSYLGVRSQVCLSTSHNPNFFRHELLYVCLYLLIWGEAANLRFTPECICYIYHHMAMELNKILDNYIDENTGGPFLPSLCCGEKNAFLNRVITPIYQTIRAEVERSRNGTSSHSAWRNYDDINEYFWSSKCFECLNWPIDVSSNFFTTSEDKRVGKTGFVEQRTFWNVFRSFDRLWVLLILFFQASIIVAWEGTTEHPWQALMIPDVQVKLLTVFITWAGLRVLQSVLEVGTQYSLVTKQTLWLGVKMVLKSIVAVIWTIVFVELYVQIWSKAKNSDGMWSTEANRRINVFHKIAFVFVIPELLALFLSFVPCIRNVIEETNWRILHLLTWWFHTRIFVGRGLGQGFVDNIKYTLFWSVVLVSKLSFSYFFQIKPLVAPTKALLNLKGITNNWDKFCIRINIMLWAPAFMIYLIDLQIWYSIFSSFVGAIVGWFSHLGKIRSIQQLRRRFQFFAIALQFNLMPEGRTMHKLCDAIQRLKLRFGLGQRKLNQVEATRFALIWNEIITILRFEDLISDRELELMELPPSCWEIKVIRCPLFLLFNQLLLALSQARELGDALDDDMQVWSKICKNEYRRCAVIEAYDSIKYLLLHVIVKDGTEEHSIFTKLFLEIDHCLQIKMFTRTYKMTLLPQIHQQLTSLIQLLIMPNNDMSELVNALRSLYELSVREFPRVNKTIEQLRNEGLAPATDVGRLFENAVQFPNVEDAFCYKQLSRLHTILTCTDSMPNVPKNNEARRRLCFFGNSLFMNIPRPPRVVEMMAFSILTPYYDEEVLYGKEMLRIPNEDGISILSYLQNTYKDEWVNFMERMSREGMEHDHDIWTTKLRDLRLWASYRGQTLSRTVRGMMYHSRALKLLDFVESATEEGIRDASLEVARSGGQLLHGHASGCALMENNEELRVAYVDEVKLGRNKVEHYSVLVKYDQQLQREVEIYRIRLPGPLKLGEGKPENQNHAFIFTRGEAVQTIDMNQDNYFEDTLKMRNTDMDSHEK